MPIPGEKAIQMVQAAHAQASQLDIAVTAVVVDQSGRITPAAGGIVIVDGFSIVGAIGVAGGGRAEQDILCCRVALSALEDSGH